MAKHSLPMMILIAAAVAACVGCAAPVQPEFKSAHSHQVNVDFENLVLLAKHGRAPFYPFSTPHCPYYPHGAPRWVGPGPVDPLRCKATPATKPEAGEGPSELPGPGAEPAAEGQ